MFTTLRLALVLALAGTGCQQIDAHKQETTLDETVRLYVRAIRWGDLPTAAALIRTREGTGTVPVLEPIAGLKVTAYDLQVESHLEESVPRALMSARFDYYFETSVRVRSVTNIGLWWYDAESERWFFEGSLPTFDR